MISLSCSLQSSPGAGVKTFIGAGGGGWGYNTEWGGGCGPKNSTSYDEMAKSIEYQGIMHNTPSLFYQNCQILNIFSQKNSSETIMKDHTEIINTETGNLLIFSWLHFF